jgi:hypothetical protein
LLVVGLYSKFAATAYCELLLAEVGIYIKFIAGLKDIGAQLWPPPGPGMIVMVWFFPYMASGRMLGRPVIRSIPVAQFNWA